MNIKERRIGVLSAHLNPAPNASASGISHAEAAGSTVQFLKKPMNERHSMEQEATILNPGAGKALKDERDNATFDVRTMTYLKDGGEVFTQNREKFMKILERDEYFRVNDKSDCTVEEHRIVVFKKVARVYDVIKQGLKNYEDEEFTRTYGMWDLITLLGVSDPATYTRFGVHNGLFKQAIRAQGTEEQQKKIIPLAESLQIYGCFAMTEAGTGSFVRGVETTATYDKKSQTFVINSPTATSRKFWIGGAGQTSTHSVVFARLLLPEEEANGTSTEIKYKDYGVHSFFVQLRSLKDHMPLPGISLGDIGKKMGRDGIDNGWIYFSSVRIPRENMLMGWSQVTPEGKYIPSPLIQLQYAPLVEGRVSICLSSSADLERVITIAIRYAAIRRQFKQKGVEDPIKLLDYQTHQYRLLPILAGNYAIHFTARELFKEYNHVITENLIKRKKVLASDLADLHNLSAGLKAFTTWFVHESMDTCRQACGGHGYSMYSGFPQAFQDHAVNCTWEGDNTVMTQQLSRYLVKSITKVFKNNNKPCLTGKSIQYLNHYHETLNSKCKVEKEEDFLDPTVQLEAYKYRACKLVANTALRMQSEFQACRNSFHAMNACQQDLVKCAKAHSYLFMVSTFIKVVSDPTKASVAAIPKFEQMLPQVDENVRAALKRLCDLFALIHIEQDLGVYLTEGYMNAEQSKMISSIIRKLLAQVRRDAVAYVDAFNLTDFMVNSPLGAYDGDIYAKYFTRMNNTDYSLKRASYYEELIKPVINPNVNL